MLQKKTVPDRIGSLMFATNARPDIQYTVSQLARCMDWPLSLIHISEPTRPY